LSNQSIGNDLAVQLRDDQSENDLGFNRGAGSRFLPLPKVVRI
jgi:hypothetical protein